MEYQDFLRAGQEALLVALVLSAPVVIAVLVVGLLVSLFQALTQIQDTTLAFVPKLVVGCAVLLATGAWAAGRLLRFGMSLLAGIAEIG